MALITTKPEEVPMLNDESPQPDMPFPVIEEDECPVSPSSSGWGPSYRDSK